MSSSQKPPVEDLPSDSDGGGSEGWDDNDEEADQEERLEIVSLLDDRVFGDAAAMLAHCRDAFGFDFVATRDRLGLDFYGSVKLVNFVRGRAAAKAANGKEAALLAASTISAADLQDDGLLRPVLPDDAFLVCLDDLPPSSSSDKGKGEDKAAATNEAETTDLAGRNAALEAQLEALTKQFAGYRLAVEQTLDKRWHADSDSESDSSSTSPAAKKKGGPPKEDNSKYYWESYANHDIHETMLKDTVRTDAYRDFIYNNKHLFKGKIVLDIGCGTGILSMFCAKAGAAHVYAIDKSAILDKARENVFLNGLADKITCLRGRVEDLVLPVARVDVIVSEWMGYCLLYEAMLPSVLWARDRYLRPETGLMVPSHATLFLAPTSDPEYVGESVTFWRDVYGFDMRPMLEGLVRDVRVQYTPGSAVCGTPAAAVALDLYTCTADDLSFRVPWASRLTRDLGDGDGIDGFVLWFDNYFATTRRPDTEKIEAPAAAWQAGRGGDGSVAFTTAPDAPDTHWKQGYLMLEGGDHHHQQPQEGKDNNKTTTTTTCYKAGDEIAGHLSFAVADVNARGLEIKVEWEGIPNAGKAQSWALH